MSNLIFHYLQLVTARAHAVYVIEGQVPKGEITNAQQVAERIVDTITFFAYPLTFVGVVYIGYKLITSQGNPDAWAAAKKNAINMIIGIALITSASALVYAFRGLLFSAF